MNKNYYVRYRYLNLFFGIFFIAAVIGVFDTLSPLAKLVLPIMCLVIAAYLVLIFSYKVRMNGMESFDEILFGKVRRTIKLQDVTAVTLIHRGIGGHFRYSYSLVGNNLNPDKKYPFFEVSGKFIKDLKEANPAILLDSYFEHPYKIRYKI